MEIGVYWQTWKVFVFLQAVHKSPPPQVGYLNFPGACHKLVSLSGYEILVETMLGFNLLNLMLICLDCRWITRLLPSLQSVSFF